MKRLMIATLVLLFTVAMNAQMENAQINFEKKSHDFGTIQEADGPATHVFKFNNIGSKPLILSNVKASCGCTTPEWTKEPILPNGTGEIKVTYNPKNRPGAFRKTITITSNSEAKSTYLTISGKVTPRVKTLEEKFPFQLGVLRAKRMHLSLFNMTNTEIKPGTVEVLNTSSAPVKIHFVDLPSHITVSDLVIPANKQAEIVFNYDASKKNDWGYVADKLTCEVDGESMSQKFQLNATITEDFSSLTDTEKANAPKATLSARKLDFGTVKRGDDIIKTFTIKNTGKSTLNIYSVKSTSTIVACSIDNDKIAVGETATVQLVLDSKRTKGRQYKTINVITNDPSAPNVTFTLSGTVQ